MYGMYGGQPLENWPQPEDFRPAEDNLTAFFTRCWIVYEGYGKLNMLIQINNRSAHPPVMKDNLSTRYFIDLSEVISAGYGPEDIELKMVSSEGAVLSGLKQWSDTIYYFELDFTGIQVMPAEWQLCEKEASVTIAFPQDAVDFENDWSYQDLTGPPDYDAASFAGKTPYLPIYERGELLWGEEPGGEAVYVIMAKFYISPEL